MVFGEPDGVVAEFFRAKDDRFFGAVSLAQVISLVLLMGGVLGVLALMRRPEPVPAVAAVPAAGGARPA